MRVAKARESQSKTIILLLFIIIASILIRSEYVIGGGRTLLRYDPYYHYRMAGTIVEEGHRPSWDYMASWPTGQPVEYAPMYHYFLAYTFRLFGALTSHDLFAWCIYSCIIIVIIMIALAYEVGKELTTAIGGLFCFFRCSSLFVSLVFRGVHRSTDCSAENQPPGGRHFLSRCWALYISEAASYRLTFAGKLCHYIGAGTCRPVHSPSEQERGSLRNIPLSSTIHDWWDTNSFLRSEIPAHPLCASASVLKYCALPLVGQSGKRLPRQKTGRALYGGRTCAACVSGC